MVATAVLLLLPGCSSSGGGWGGCCDFDPLDRDRSTPSVTIDNAGDLSCAPALVSSYVSERPWVVGSRFVVNVVTQTGSVLTSSDPAVLSLVELRRSAIVPSSISGAGDRISVEVELLLPGRASVLLQKPADVEPAPVATFDAVEAEALDITVVEGHEYGQSREERSYGELALLAGGLSDVALLVRTLGADGNRLCGAPPITSDLPDGWSLRSEDGDGTAAPDANEIVWLSRSSEALDVPPAWTLELEAVGLRTAVPVRIVPAADVTAIVVEPSSEPPFRYRARPWAGGAVHGGTVEVAAWTSNPGSSTCGAHGRRELDEGGHPVFVLSNSCPAPAPVRLWLAEHPESENTFVLDPDASDAPPLVVEGNQDCSSAHPIPPIGGEFVGVISSPESHFSEPGCGAHPGPEGVFELHLDTRQRVRLRAWGAFDGTGLHVRGELCSDGALTFCASDFMGRIAIIEQVFEAGTHFIVVDGPLYRRPSGPYGVPRSYNLEVSITEP